MARNSCPKLQTLIFSSFWRWAFWSVWFINYIRYFGYRTVMSVIWKFQVIYCTEWSPLSVLLQDCKILKILKFTSLTAVNFYGMDFDIIAYLLLVIYFICILALKVIEYGVWSIFWTTFCFLSFQAPNMSLSRGTTSIIHQLRLPCASYMCWCCLSAMWL